MACCAGSLFFGYFNESYFWVVNRTLGVSEAKDSIKSLVVHVNNCVGSRSR
ncbi:MAG: hypothetical protein IJP48_06880 [Synergistaceae bacterium]|nr:hypothetical protein [Synergistaceae bacterium]